MGGEKAASAESQKPGGKLHGANKGGGAKIVRVHPPQGKEMDIFGGGGGGGVGGGGGGGFGGFGGVGGVCSCGVWLWGGWWLCCVLGRAWGAGGRWVVVGVGVASLSEDSEKFL